MGYQKKAKLICVASLFGRELIGREFHSAEEFSKEVTRRGYFPPRLIWSDSAGGYVTRYYFKQDLNLGRKIMVYDGLPGFQDRRWRQVGHVLPILKLSLPEPEQADR